MPALLALLGSLLQQGLSFAKWLAGQIKVITVRLALKAKDAAVAILYFTSKRAVFYAACFVLFQAALGALTFYVATPLSSSLISTLLPTSGKAQFFYHFAWESGLSLKLAWSLSLVYLGQVFVAHRVVDVFADALSYRLMIWQGQHQYSLGMLSGRG